MIKHFSLAPRSSGPICNLRWLTRRRFVKGFASLVGAAFGTTATLNIAEAATADSYSSRGAVPGCSKWKRPTDTDFEMIIGQDKELFIDRVLSLIENEMVPKTMEGVKGGSKLFGAAVLKKSDLSTLLVATNTEADDPLLHGEITAIHSFYEIPKDQRPSAKDAIFISSHEPCPLCLSGITWGGFDNFFYLFTYEDSRDAYGIPHDIVMLDEIFRCPDGSYSEKNKYWSAWGIRDLIASTTPEQRTAFGERIDALRTIYAEISDIYQSKKAEGTGADVPLK